MVKDWEDALWSGDSARARHLLQSGVEIDSEERPRQTRLRLLAEAGADRTIRGSGAPGFEGMTALDLAEKANRQGFAAVLRA